MQVDLDHLSGIFRGDRALVKEWIDLYLEESPQYFDQLTDARQCGDAQAMAHAAHDLRPQARYMGCARMHELLAIIEECAMNDASSCDDQLNELIALRWTVEAELRTALQE